MSDTLTTRPLPLLVVLVVLVSLGLASLRPVLAAGEMASVVETAVVSETAVDSPISPIFTPEVQAWASDIERWAAQFGLDPNHVAIIMQIESCGWQQAVSSAGAQGLFQVMPFHFAPGEVMLDPNTNAQRGLAYYAEGLSRFGDPALAFAGYNGGHGTAANAPATWPNETQRYHRWASGILADLASGVDRSPTIEAWLAAGGANLCASAAAAQGLSATN